MSTPAQFLLTHFDRLAEAPGGIAKLRALVLQLAITGTLLPQSKADESATKLLARIRTDRARITKKPVTSTPIDRSEVEVEIPAEWEWIKLGDLCSKTGSGSTPRGGKTAYTTSGIPFLRSQNVYDDGLRLEGVAYITPEIHTQMSGTAVVPGDLLLNITGGSIGRCAIVPNSFTEGNVSQHVAILRPVIAGMSGYLHLVVLSPYFQTVMLGSQTGAGREGLPKNRMDEILIPLPPLAEQQRIVAKVEELMCLCDALEVAQRERETVRTRLRTSALHQLVSPDSDSTSATFVLKNLSLFTITIEEIVLLRQTVFGLAVGGRLVPQNPYDEPAAELLSRISSKRTKLLKSGYPNQSEATTQLRKQEAQTIPSGLTQLPNGWQWATLIQCSALVIDCHNKTAPYSTSGIVLLRTTNVRDGMLNLKQPKFVDENTYTRWSARCQPEPGDILITREAPMGEVCVIPKGMKICLGQRMMLARLVPDTIDPQFMLYSLRDPNLMDRVQDKPVGATVQHLRVGGVETLLIPLPPLAEQRQIVAKVDELMAMLDALEAALTTARTTTSSLLAATVARLHAA